MQKKIFFVALMAVFTLTLFACGSDSTTSTDEEATEENTIDLAWPSEYMSVLPEPESAISDIQKLNGTEEIDGSDTTTEPTSVNVVMNEMTAAEANAYYEELKSAGFTINTDQNDDEKIQIVGTLNDDANNPFLFSYDPEYHLGNVSITHVSQ